MSPTPLKVALVGYGFAGKTFHAPLIAATPGLELHTIVSSDAAKVRADFPEVAVVNADLVRAVADPAIDLVVIATPDTLHASQAHIALDAGKHVVIDKPFSVTLDEARAIADHGRRADRLVSVFQNRRWDSDFLTLQALIERGHLGEIVQYESHFDRFRPLVSDRWREKPGAGVLLDLGPHLIDQALVLFGKPQAVYADIAVQKDGGVAGDYFHLLLRYPRLRALLHASQMTQATNLRLAVHGTAGSFIKSGLDTQEDQLKAGLRPGAPGYGDDPRLGVLIQLEDGEPVSTPVQPLPGNYRTYYARIRDAITGGAPSPVPVEEALRVMEVIDAAQRSAAERREIVL
ncbi:oxidoreductase [Caulobacter sp. ErkDOM-E]|uniref:oxidoreductase n=1 Tax=Caulobacter sp. ErkDOM-E TaxID=3402778 RepID=UPI003AF6B7F8